MHPVLTGLVIFVLLRSTLGFLHPGITVSRGQLDYVKAKIAQGAQPWAAAYSVAVNSRYGNASWVPTPYEVVECGSFNKPNIGCGAELDDGAHAYTLALLWYYSRNAKYLNRAIYILDAWSAKLRTHNNSNAPLQAAWASEWFTKAGEIVRHTSTAWPAASIDRFATVLQTAFLPLIYDGNGWSNGNWELSMANGVVSVGIFLDNSTIFNKGINLWRARVPAYIYYTPPDGSLPVPPPGGHYTTISQLNTFWHSPDGSTPYFNGRCQETCRDFGHVSLGFTSLSLAAETALIQGVDLYSTEKLRLAKSFKFHSNLQNNHTSIPSNLCNGNITLFYTSVTQFEVMYNALANRLNVSMPATRQFILKYRPIKYAAQSTIFEALTHAETGWNGINRLSTTASATTTPSPTPTVKATTTPPPTTATPKPTTPPPTSRPPSSRIPSSDYNGDGKSDYAIWRPSSYNSTWYVDGIRTSVLGKMGDVPAPADFDGDRKTDLVSFRNGTWLVSTSSSPAQNLTYSFGAAGDIPIPADYDGDGKADLAVFRPTNGTWKVKTSSSGYTSTLGAVTFGQKGDFPIPADYTGDGKADFALWSPKNFTFNVAGVGVFKLGLYTTDIPLVMDVDGDGKSDLVIFRGLNATWKFMLSSEKFTSTHSIVGFGLATDVPISGFDRDGDGKSDFTLYRSGQWLSLLSSTSYSANASKSFGRATDFPLPGRALSQIAYINGVIVAKAETTQVTPSGHHPVQAWWIVVPVVVAAVLVALAVVLVVWFVLKRKPLSANRTEPLLQN